MAEHSECTEKDKFNPYIRSLVRQGLLDSEHKLLYYQKLSDKYRVRRNIMRFLILSSVLIEVGIVTVGPLMIGSINIALVMAGWIVLLVVWESVSDYTTKVTQLDWVKTEVFELNAEWHTLWTSIKAYKKGEDEAYSERQELLRKFSAIVSKLDMVIDNKLNERTLADACKAVMERYETCK